MRSTRLIFLLQQWSIYIYSSYVKWRCPIYYQYVWAPGLINFIKKNCHRLIFTFSYLSPQLSSHLYLKDTFFLSCHKNFISNEPLLWGHLYYKATFSCPVIENFISNEPLLWGHMYYKATFSFPQMWPLNTGLTVFVITTMYILNMCS